MKSEDPTSYLESKSNPFATRRVRPGEIPWIGKQQHSLDAIVSSWESHGGRTGAIIGPHGTGKSTLLCHLVPRCFPDPVSRPSPAPDFKQAEQKESGASVVAWLQLRRGTNVSFSCFPAALKRAEVRDWILDGFEQLWFHQKAYVICRQRIRGGKLLVTAHGRQIGIPVIYETKSSPELTQDLVNYLLRASITTHASDQKPDARAALERLVANCWQKHGGNIREVFMDLYDRIGNGSTLVGDEHCMDEIGT